MGISSGATLGAVIASIVPGIMALTGKTGLGAYISPVNLCAFVGALVAGLFVTSLAFSRGGRSSLPHRPCCSRVYAT